MARDAFRTIGEVISIPNRVLEIAGDIAMIHVVAAITRQPVEYA